MTGHLDHRSPALSPLLAQAMDDADGTLFSRLTLTFVGFILVALFNFVVRGRVPRLHASLRPVGVGLCCGMACPHDPLHASFSDPPHPPPHTQNFIGHDCVARAACTGSCGQAAAASGAGKAEPATTAAASEVVAHTA